MVSTEEGGDQELSFGGMAPGGRGGELLDFLVLPGLIGTGRKVFDIGWESAGRVESGGWIKPFSFPGSSSEVGFERGCVTSGTCRLGFAALSSRPASAEPEALEV